MNSCFVQSTLRLICISFLMATDFNISTGIASVTVTTSMREFILFPVICEIQPHILLAFLHWNS